MDIVHNRPTADDCSSIAVCLADVIVMVGGMDETELFFDVDIEPGMPDVRCNASALRSAILNLLLNAREAMTGSGVIAIRGRAISRGRIAIGTELSIADNGIGMSPAAIACAFDPFFTTKCDGLGGVGLPMVERFVRDVGGEISIESEQGIGTTVTLKLPASALIVNGG
jgi:signal transduction histidine kinase